jgi:O-antigen/teichoic acid export membrane protein
LSELDRGAEKSARGSLYLFMGNFLSEIINAVGVVLVARLLTPEEYGVYNIAFVLPFLFVMFSNWGVGAALTRFLARYQEEGRWGEIRGMIGKGLAFNGGLSLLLTAIMYVSADFLAETILLRPGLGGLVRLTSVIVLLFSLFNTVSAIYFGLERMDIIAALIVVVALIRSVMSPLLVSMGYGVPGALMGYMVGYGVALLIGLILLAREIRREDRSADLSGDGSLGDMLRFGFPLFIGSFVGGLGFRYQGLLQVWFASDLVIGNLNIATKFKSLAGLFTVPIASSIYPAFSKFRFDEKREEMVRMFGASVRYATMIVIPVTLLVMVVSEPIVVALFGREYAQAPFFLAIAVLEFLSVGLGSLSVIPFLNSQGDTGTTLRFNLVSVGIMVTLCTALTWQFGITGLLVGIVVSAVLGNAYNLYRTRKKYELDFDLLQTLRVATFSVVAAGLTYAVMEYVSLANSLLHAFAASFIFIAFCMVLAPLTGAVTQQDIRTIRGIVRRGFGGYSILAPFLDLEERLVLLFQKAG